MQYETFTCSDGSTLAYQTIPGKSPGIFFLGGFMSDMFGTKANFLAEVCRQRGQAFTRFDYFGHGKSSGQFLDGTIGRWKQNALTILDEVTHGPQILVGSSMGGWLMVLVAKERNERLKALVGIASAPDFTSSLAERLEPYRQQLESMGFCYFPSIEENPYPITKQLIEDGTLHLVLKEEIKINLPVRLLHGKEDHHVPWQQSLSLMERLESKDIILTLIKNGDHRLADPYPLSILEKTIFELIEH